MARSVSILVPVFGSDRMVNDQIAQALGPCEWLGIPCAGGMGILQKVKCRSVIVGDLHWMIINLARVAAHAQARIELVDRLRACVFHPHELEQAQHYCKAQYNASRSFCLQQYGGGAPALDQVDYDVNAAYHYFVACWMGRSGIAATDKEFEGNLSVRWNAGGGDSNTRYRSAIRSLLEFAEVYTACNFVVMDCFDFLPQVQDKPGHGLYLDPPWPDDGDKYRHKFTPEQQDQLAGELQRFQKARVVLRMGDHPETMRRYSERYWTRIPVTSRTQGNNDKAEYLFVNKN